MFFSIIVKGDINMEKKPLRKFLLTMIVLMLFSILGMNLVKRNRYVQSTEKKFYGFFSMIRYSLFDYPVETFASITDDYATFWQQRFVNQELRQKLESYVLLEEKVKQLEEEVDSLKELNKLDSVYSEFELISGRVIERSFDSWNKVVTINIGTENGVSVDDGVITPKGLVGRVIAVEKNTATVSLLTSNEDFARVSVTIKTDDDEVHGILEQYDYQSKLFTLKLLENNRNLKPGSEILSSGIGGVFPKGIYVGEVDSIEVISDGIGLNAYMKSKVNYNDLDYIKVVKKP